MPPVDIATLTWAAMGTALRYSFHHDAVEYKGAMYWVGGFEGSASQTWFYKFIPTTGFTAMPVQMPQGRAGHCSVIAGDDLYVCGGFVGAPTGHTGLLTRYNFNTQTWVTLAPCPNTHSYGDMVHVNGKLYVFGGMTSSAAGETPAKFIQWCYEIATNTWVELNTGISARLDMGACVIDNKIYLLCGRYNSAYFRVLYRYDPSDGSLVTLAQPPAAASGRRSLLNFYGVLVSVFGMTSASATYNAVNYYDIPTNTWKTLNTYAGFRSFGACAVLGNRIYYHSGIRNGTGLSDSIVLK